MSWYTGHMLSAQECHFIDRTGIPCGQPTIAEQPVPMCESHARILHNVLTSALLRAEP